MNDEELLEVGQERRPGLPWRWRALLLVAALTLGITAYVVDRQMREREGRAVSACAERTNTAVDMAGRRVRAAYEYVRPSLFDPSPELLDGAKRLFADAAQGEGAPLEAPRASCTQVTVFPWHDGLQSRRDRCVAVLDAQRSGLAAVATDGGALDEWLDAPRTC